MCSAVLTPSQGLLSVPCSASQQVHKKLGGSRTRTADPKWPQGYSTPWNARLSTPAGRIGQEGLITAQELAGHPQQVVSIVLCTTCEVLFLSLSPFCYCYYYYIISVTEQFLFQPTSFITFHSDSPLLPTVERESQQVSQGILSCQMGLNHNILKGIHKPWDV